MQWVIDTYMKRKKNDRIFVNYYYNNDTVCYGPATFKDNYCTGRYYLSVLGTKTTKHQPGNPQISNIHTEKYC